MVFCTARRQGALAQALDRVYSDHVWVYFLLDKDQRVRDYYFLSFAELRKLEQKAASQ
jgi:hypothetical protein